MSFDPTQEELQIHDGAAEALRRLLALMHRLRAKDGCPWDAKQTMESLRPYLIEESYEVLEAIDLGDPALHLEELGDLLLQIVFQAELASEEGLFEMRQVTEGIIEKLVVRHPHVFGGADAHDAEEALLRWEEIKAQEKAKAGRSRESVIDGVPLAAPALLRAERIGDKAASVGFDWREIGQVRNKLDEELRELDLAIEAEDPSAIEDELGDVLFTLANLGRHLKVPAEDALRQAVLKFSARFRIVEQGLKREGLEARSCTDAELEARWQRAKEDLREQL